MVDDSAHYRWSSYRANGLGPADPLLTPHAVYAGLGSVEANRLAAYQALFRPELNHDAMGDIRLALNQGQPLGNSRFLDRIEQQAFGQRRELRPRGRPRKPGADSGKSEPGPFSSQNPRGLTALRVAHSTTSSRRQFVPPDYDTNFLR